MSNLFGVNIKGIVASALGPGLLAATLIQRERGARSGTAGAAVTETSYPCKGVVEDFALTVIDGTNIQRGDRRVLLLGGTLPDGVEPRIGDRVTIEGGTRTVVNVQRDPAGASYSLQVR